MVEVTDAHRAQAAKSRAEQGLPPTVEDEQLLDEVARLIRASEVRSRAA